jgi:hypothetical protein
MGWGRITKAIKKPLIGAVGGAMLGGPFGAIVGAGLGRKLDLNQSSKLKKAQAQAQAQMQDQQRQLEQLAQEKAIASESVRLQEEEARKRTLFAGTTLGQTAERKKLLGL